MHLTRRTFVAGATLGVLSGLSGRAAAVSIGEKSLMTISDGKLVLPINFVLPDVPEQEVERLLTVQGLPTDQVEHECNLTLLRDGTRTVLFDAGSGSNFLSTAGLLGDNLLAEGIDPEDVTDVVFTHAHPDHLWGILDDFDEIAFPNAQLHIARTEWDFWRSGDAIEIVGDARQTFAVGAQNRFAAMEERVQLFDAGAEVLPDIEAVDTSGHTPGHTSFAIHAGGDYLMVIGDAIINHVISFQRPEWPFGSDQDVQKGIASRSALLDRLSQDKARMIGFHLPNGGLGRVERYEQAYRFVQM